MPGNASYDDILSTTLAIYAKTIQDQVFENLLLFKTLKEADHVKEYDGGESVVLQLQEAKNTNAESYSAWQVLKNIPIKPFTSARFEWAQYNVPVHINGLEAFQNKGERKIIDLLQGRTANARMSLQDLMNTDMFAAQTGTALNGLQTLVSDDGTGTVGEIVAGTYTYWKNKFAPSVGGPANLYGAMKTLYNDCTFGLESPNWICTTQTDYEVYETIPASHEAFVNVVDGKTINVGYPALSFKTKPVYFDRACGTGRMYMLNLDHIWLAVADDHNFSTTPFMVNPDQDGKVARIFFYGQLVTDSRRTQGVLSGITT